MFNLFGKKEEPSLNDKYKEIYKELTTNQRMSYGNVLFIIAFCDSNQDPNKEELDFINSRLNSFNISLEECLEYDKSQKMDKITADLSPIKQHLKELLVWDTHHLIMLRENRSKAKIDTAFNICAHIGIDEEKYISIIKLQQNMIKSFNIGGKW